MYISGMGHFDKTLSSYVSKEITWKKKFSLGCKPFELVLKKELEFMGMVPNSDRLGV